MTIVEVRDVCKSYTLGEQEVLALHDVSLSIESGDFLAICGPSGSGKSTLLNIIGCIDNPSSGRVLIDGEDVSGRTSDELADLRARSIGFIFQTFNLLPVLSAAENVDYPLMHLPELDRAERRHRVAHYLNVVGLERFADHRPSQLSGGQRQRVAIARALATHARVILADEPTANLDRENGQAILELMRDINLEEGTTFVFSTHDAHVMALAERLVTIEDGRIVSKESRAPVAPTAGDVLA